MYLETLNNSNMSISAPMVIPLTMPTLPHPFQNVPIL